LIGIAMMQRYVVVVRVTISIFTCDDVPDELPASCGFEDQATTNKKNKTEPNIQSIFIMMIDVYILAKGQHVDYNLR
jgi:hypothetical protein